MPETRKTALLNAAKELFGQLGYAETTFKKISEKANVALGLLTHHYGNKEKLFLAAGVDVLEHFLVVLHNATTNANTGLDGVMSFCKAYLDFSVDPTTHWMVLVRCSPYSDMKTKHDRDTMHLKFNEVHTIIEKELLRGVKDSSIHPISSYVATAQVLVSIMVGANRTENLTPNAAPDLFKETLDFIYKSLTNKK